jgi:hypothetical protein
MAQPNRLNTYGNIGWYNVFSTFKLKGNFSLHGEYQWRRNEIINEWQQSLLRLGVNFQIRPDILLRAGYAWVETFSYGEIPINSFEKKFTEHRIFEMLQLRQPAGRWDITHRFMLEQRFIGQFKSATDAEEYKFPLSHRVRYLSRWQFPLWQMKEKKKKGYAVLYDELFIGIGKQVNANVFDQNRCGALLGFSFNENINCEAGYLYQIIQFGRQINGKNIFQYNQGPTLNFYVRNNRKFK